MHQLVKRGVSFWDTDCEKMSFILFYHDASIRIVYTKTPERLHCRNGAVLFISHTNHWWLPTAVPIDMHQLSLISCRKQVGVFTTVHPSSDGSVSHWWCKWNSVVKHSSLMKTLVQYLSLPKTSTQCVTVAKHKADLSYALVNHLWIFIVLWSSG